MKKVLIASLLSSILLIANNTTIASGNKGPGQSSSDGHYKAKEYDKDRERYMDKDAEKDTHKAKEKMQQINPDAKAEQEQKRLLEHKADQ